MMMSQKPSLFHWIILLYAIRRILFQKANKKLQYWRNWRTISSKLRQSLRIRMYGYSSENCRFWCFNFINCIQWTLSTSTTLYLEYLSISTKFSVPWTIFSLYLEHLHIRISFSNSQINSNLNQNKNFDRKWKKKIVFCSQCCQNKNVCQT